MAEKEVGQLKATVSLTTTEFSKGIETLSKQMSIVREEFKLASGSLDKVKDAMQISKLKADELTQRIEIQKKIVAQMSEAHKYAAERFGEGSKQAVNYELKLKKSETTLQGLEKQLAATTAQLNKQGVTAAETAKRFQELGVSWQSVGQKFSDIGKAMSVAITAPLLAGAGAGLKFNATMEDFTANFETMLGSADKAKTMLAELTAFAKATPFEMTGLADSAKILLNFGVNSNDVMKDIQMLGDVSLGNHEKLGRLTLAFGQIQSTGRLMGQDLLQLINAGFNPLQIISEKTGRSMASLKKDMEAGAISSDMVTEAFRIATSEGGTFYKAMDKGSKTFNGQMSTLKDTVNITLGETMKPLFDDLSKNILPKIIASIEKLGKTLSSLSEEQKLNVLKWAAIAAAAGPVLLVIGKLITTIPALITGVKLLGTAFAFLAANPIILGIAAIAAAIGIIVYAAGSANREIQKMTASLIESYRKEAEAQKAAIDKTHATRIGYLNDQLSTEETASSKRLKVIQDEYDAEVKGAGKKEQALKKNLQERQSALDKAHNDAIKQIQEEYGVFEEKTKSKTQVVQDEANAQKDIVKEVLNLSKDIATQEGDAFSKTYDAILKKASEIHDEKIKMYQEEYLKSVSLINQDLAAKVKGYQDEIDKINNKTKEEDRIAKEQDDRQRILDLQAKVDSATNDEDRKSANQDLADEINRQNREKELANRKIQVDSLNEQMKTAVTKANEDKQNALNALNDKVGKQQIVIDAATQHTIDQIQAERKAKETAENAKYNAAKKSLDDQETAMDGYGERYKAQLDEELKKKQEIEAAKLKATLDTINASIAAGEAKATSDKAAVDEQIRITTETAKLKSMEAELKKLNDINPMLRFLDPLQLANNQIYYLENDIKKEKQRLHNINIPGFTSGVVDWKGGLARVNENGGEIRYHRPEGMTVIPHDVSMGIAKAVGDAVGNNVQGGTVNVNLIVDGKTLAQVTAPYQQQLARDRGREGAVM